MIAAVGTGCVYMSAVKCLTNEVLYCFSRNDTARKQRSNVCDSEKDVGGLTKNEMKVVRKQGLERSNIFHIPQV